MTSSERLTYVQFTSSVQGYWPFVCWKYTGRWYFALKSLSSNVPCVSNLAKQGKWLSISKLHIFIIIFFLIFLFLFFIRYSFLFSFLFSFFGGSGKRARLIVVLMFMSQGRVDFHFYPQEEFPARLRKSNGNFLPYYASYRLWIV